MVRIDGQKLTVEEFEDILCDQCHNAPLAYYCPACDFKVCGDCIPLAFLRRKKHLTCKRCGHVDKKLATFVSPEKL